MYSDVIFDALQNLNGLNVITDPLIRDMLISMDLVRALSDTKGHDGASFYTKEALLTMCREYIDSFRVRTLSKHDIEELLAEVTDVDNLCPNYAYADIYEPSAVIDMIACILRVLASFEEGGPSGHSSNEAFATTLEAKNMYERIMAMP